ncbi:MAG: hypothetical protein K1X53_00235 [Candidatus Sumerlaeaceae bacterium]|nr:hypothetical protein [Candidatus Sumerlaeaceae bacterium]
MRRQLFVDKDLIEKSENLDLRMHSPVPREAVFSFDAPWEGKESGYTTVFRDDNELRMYYRGGGETTQEVACLATSNDGVSWIRPKFGLYAFNGSKDNNIVYVGRGTSYWEAHNFTPFKDTNTSTPAEQRYKALGLGRHKTATGETVKALVALISADGIHWTLLQEAPVITKGSFDSQNVAFWDSVRNQYVCYSRHGRNGVRSVQLSTSPDFIHWTEPKWLNFGPGTLEQFYTNAIQPYPLEPSLYLGFPMRFVPARKSIGFPERKVDGLSDSVLISSHDGLDFTRTFREAFIRPGLDVENWGSAHSNNTPACGLLQTSDSDISLYWAEHCNMVPRMRRGTIRTDGFASVHAGDDTGRFLTPPLRFSGRRLLLNVSTSAAGSVRVGIRDAGGLGIPGFDTRDCIEVYGDELNRIVLWNGNPSLERLAINPIRLEFEMKDADLYSFRFAQ